MDKTKRTGYKVPRNSGDFCFATGGKPYFCFMINKITALLIAIMAIACSDGSYSKAEDAQDAGRQFIRASLDGDYKKARFFMLKDDDNIRFLDKSHSDYNHLDKEARQLYRDAVIRPVNIEKVNDSLTRYSYYHTSNPSDTVTLNVLRYNDEWLVDLKSMFGRQQ